MSFCSLLWRAHRARYFRAAITALAVVATLAVRAQPGAQRPPPSLGEKTSEALAQLRQMQDAKEWAAMLKLLDGIPGVKPGSYDEALILDMKARIYGMMEQPSKALEPWGRALALADQHGYFPEKQTLEILLYLGHLHSQELAGTKDPARQQHHSSKAIEYFRRYIATNPNPPSEVMVGYATMLFYRATADNKNVDTAMLEEAKGVISRGLLSALKPREGFYQLQLAVLQQQNDLSGASEVLELMLAQKPAHKDFWPALMSFYVQLSDRAKESDPRLSREYLVRAILTYERAQKNGFLNSPKDNLHLVSLYLATNQFTRGTAMLYEGMKKGTIESDPNNWRLLGHYYHEANQTSRAIEVLKEAVKLFPQSSELEVQLAQIHSQIEKYAEALTHARAALTKGKFEGTKPFAMHNLIAFLAYDLGRLDEAQQAIDAAEKYPAEVAKDPQFPTVKNAVAEAVRDREERARKQKEKEAAAEASKKAAAVR